jgi:hypothetical protein
LALAVLALVALASCQPVRERTPEVVPFEYLPVRESDMTTPSVGGQRTLRVPSPSTRRNLRVRVREVPKEVQLGDRLEYVVELNNPTRRDVELDPCPAYYSAFGESGTATFIESYLNCGHAPSSVPARGSLHFAMEIEVPAGAVQPGSVGTLYWRLPAAGPSRHWDDSSREVRVTKGP